jgi:hypothetical protein
MRAAYICNNAISSGRRSSLMLMLKTTKKRICHPTGLVTNARIVIPEIPAYGGEVRMGNSCAMRVGCTSAYEGRIDLWS